MSIERFHLRSDNCTGHVRQKKSAIAGHAPWQRRKSSRRDMHPGISSVVGCTLRRYPSSSLTAVSQSIGMVKLKSYFLEINIITRFQTQTNASRRVFVSHSLAIIMVSNISAIDPLVLKYISLRPPDVISAPGLPEYPAVLFHIPHHRGARPHPRYPLRPLQLHSRTPTIASTNAMQ